MFDGLFRGKFYTKCKSLIKRTKVRMEAIKKRRNAMQKHLRNDIADLLRSGLDIIAYERAVELLVDLNKSSCYDLIEQFYDSISSHLSVMDKQKECPEECREAVASLMYAAARFGDLPELRGLRNLFTQRYGNSMEGFVNKEFVEKLRSKPPPTKDMKIQLLQDIAQDSSMEWNSKALEQKLYTPPPPELVNNDQDGQKKSSNTATDGSPEEADSRKPVYSRFMPPPYVRPKATPPADSEGTEMAKYDKVRPSDSVEQGVGGRTPPGRDNAGSSASDEAAMESKARKDPPRASFEPDTMNSTGHVHPKLPDYDDLAARIAALSGR